jgi:hypothetical protein
MVTSVQTIVSRIKTPPNGGVSRKLWFIAGAFFAFAFLYEVVRWSCGRGEPSQIAFTAGFLSMAAFSVSRGGRVRVLFFICGMALLMIAFVTKFFHFV